MRWDLTNHILIPERGETSDLFYRLSNYISEFDTMWKDRISPASPADIEMFNQIINQNTYPGKHKIPNEYYIFLEYMGEDDGGLLSQVLNNSYISRAELNESYLEDVSKFYPELKCCPYVPFLCNDIVETELSFDLSSENTHQIVVTNGEELYGKTGDTLEKLLFRCAFRRFYLPSAARFASVASKQFCYNNFAVNTTNAYNSLFQTNSVFFDFITQIERKFSFTEVWFSNKEGYFNDCYIGISTDSKMVMSIRHCYNTLFGTISGYAVRDIQEVKEFLSSYHQIKLDIKNPYFVW